MRASAHGISIEAPHGWEVRIFKRPQAMPVMHLATFGLSGHDGDFGAAATARMTPGDAFAALVEYQPDHIVVPGAGLFREIGIPRISAAGFSPAQLQVTRPGQLGRQLFFTASGRPFCLYCVVSPEHAGDRGAFERLSAVLRSLAV